MTAIMAEQQGITPRKDPLNQGGFSLVQADSIVNHSSSIQSLASGFPTYAMQSVFGFRYNPLFGPLANMDFMKTKIQARRAYLAVANCDFVHGLTFDQQKALLPSNLRPIKAIEAVATLMAYHREQQDQPDKLNYPEELEHLWFWCDDIISLSTWPKWYQGFRGITTDCRVAIRVDQQAGLVLDYFPVNEFKSWVDWVTPDPESYRTIAIAATLV